MGSPVSPVSIHRHLPSQLLAHALHDMSLMIGKLPLWWCQDDYILPANIQISIQTIIYQWSWAHTLHTLHDDDYIAHMMIRTPWLLVMLIRVMFPHDDFNLRDGKACSNFKKRTKSVKMWWSDDCQKQQLAANFFASCCCARFGSQLVSPDQPEIFDTSTLSRNIWHFCTMIFSSRR